MENLWINETFVQARENEKRYGAGSSDWYESFTNNLGVLFRSCQKEYGRCTSKMYIGEGDQIGWVFEKKKKFSDCNEYFIAETWVEISKTEPNKVCTIENVNHPF